MGSPRRAARGRSDPARRLGLLLLPVLARAPVGCISWRQTGGCVPTGPREPDSDRSCDQIVPAGASGARHAPMPLPRSIPPERSDVLHPIPSQATVSAPTDSASWPPPAAIHRLSARPNATTTARQRPPRSRARTVSPGERMARAPILPVRAGSRASALRGRCSRRTAASAGDKQKHAIPTADATTAATCSAT